MYWGCALVLFSLVTFVSPMVRPAATRTPPEESLSMHAHAPLPGTVDTRSARASRVGEVKPNAVHHAPTLHLSTECGVSGVSMVPVCRGDASDLPPELGCVPWRSPRAPPLVRR